MDCHAALAMMNSNAMTAHTIAPSACGISLFDARPFFEKALQYGVRHGIIEEARLEAICQDAPKGMVQIARYFGTEFLRPELEKAKDRMVNLVSLYLEDTSGGDLRRAAESLREHSLLSRSKGGSDMLKKLIAMPQHSHFGMHERAGFSDEQIPLLAKWSLRSYADYQTELAQRSEVAQVVSLANRDLNKGGWLHPSVHGRVRLLEELAGSPVRAAGFARRLVWARVLILALFVAGLLLQVTHELRWWGSS